MNKNYSVDIANEDEMEIFARNFCNALTHPAVICLNGSLGAGKTVFSRSIIRALCGDDSLSVPSPTFTLVQVYESSHGDIYHYDWYRLEEPEEIYELGWEEALSAPLVLVEWSEKAEKFLPEKRIAINILIDPTDAEKRHIEVIYHD